MADLISSADKTRFDGIFDSIHDTFARDITIYKTSKKTFVATNNTYNALYSRIKNEKGSSKEVEAITVKARIAYLNPQDKEDELSYQLGVSVPSGLVRIKLSEEGYAILKQSKDIEIDGELFDTVSDASKVGMFSVKYSQIYLKRRD